jgi:hypothetical protein
MWSATSHASRGITKLFTLVDTGVTRPDRSGGLFGQLTN